MINLEAPPTSVAFDSAALSVPDALALEQVVALCEVSDEFRQEFERDSVGAVIGAASAHRIKPLSDHGERCLATFGLRNAYELAERLDTFWSGEQRVREPVSS